MGSIFGVHTSSVQQREPEQTLRFVAVPGRGVGGAGMALHDVVCTMGGPDAPTRLCRTPWAAARGPDLLQICECLTGAGRTASSWRQCGSIGLGRASGRRANAAGEQHRGGRGLSVVLAPAGLGWRNLDDFDLAATVCVGGGEGLRCHGCSPKGSIASGAVGTAGCPRRRCSVPVP